MDLSNNYLKLKNGAKIILRDIIPPKDFDFSICSEIRLFNPDLRHYNLNAKDAWLYIHHNFFDGDNADYIDFSNCNNVTCDIHFSISEHRNFSDIKVIGGKKMNFSSNGHDSGKVELDFSNTDDLILNVGNWGLKNIKFKEGSSLEIRENIPKGTDLSMFDKIKFSVRFPDIEDVIFKDGVNLDCDFINLYTHRLKDGIDFSKFGQVTLGNYVRVEREFAFGDSRKVKFFVRDRAQLNEIARQLPEDAFRLVEFVNKSNVINKIVYNLKKTK